MPSSSPWWAPGRPSRPPRPSRW
uniref:Uncharacterized protein n=1 Tax=Arundo donax TaxID=35708 RepID=A0A0A8Y508_ARUDO